MSKKETLRGFDPSQFQVISEPNFDPKEFQVISTPETEIDFKANEGAPIKRVNPDDILSNVKTNNDSEKQTLKSLAIAVNEGKAKHEDLVDAIQTFEGTHKNQEGGGRYYMTEENGIYKPIPLSKTEQPPADKNVAKIFEDSSVFEDLGNSIKAGAAKLGSSLLRAPGFVFDLPGNALGVEAELPSTQLSRDLGVNTTNTTADLLDEKAKEAKAQIVQKYDKGITDYVVAGEYGKAVGALGNAVAESLPVTLSLMAGNVAGLSGTGSTLLGGAVFGADKRNELEQETTDLSTDKKNAIAMGYGLAEGFFEQFGLTKLGSITKEVLKKEGKDAAKVFAENAFKEVYEKPLVGLVGTLGAEASSEAATQFAQNAIDKYSGYKPDKDLTEGVIDAALVGLGAGAVIGGAAKATEKGVDRKLQKENEQSQYAYEVSKKGTDAVNAFKADIDNFVKTGEMSADKAAAAKLKVDAFKEYHDQTADLPLNDEAKREVFDKTYQKTILEAKIKNYNEETVNAIELAKIDGLKKQAKHLQEDINKLVLSAQIKEETTVGNKAIDGEVKDEVSKTEPAEDKPKTTNEHLLGLQNKYKESKPVKKDVETRTYKEIPINDFNHKDYNARFAHEALANELESLPDKQMTGTITERHFINPNSDKQNSIFFVKLPDGKKIRFASSMVRDEGFRGHMRTEHLEGRDLEGFPVGVKLEYLPEGKKVIKIFNGLTGKPIGWAKETNTGKNITVNEKQIEQLEHLMTQVEKPIASAEEIKPNEQLQKQKAKKANLDIGHHRDVLRVTKHIQSVLPKVNVVYNKTLVGKKGNPLSGRVQGNLIEINPFYAGKDTPIHEAGHILIDAKGYNSQLIQDGINQLKGTKLWAETAQRYDELNEEMLGKEVLAEAIGREGADIFDTEVAKNKFQKFLDKLLAWFKNKLGLEKNVAKQLAQEVLRGDANLTGQSEIDQEQRTDLDNFREKTLGRNLEEEENDLMAIEEALINPDIAEEDKAKYQEIKDKIANRINKDQDKYNQHSKNANEMNEIVSSEDLSKYSLDDLLRVYRDSKDSEGYVDYTLLEKAKKRIGFFLEQNQINFLEKSQPEYFDKTGINKKDLGYIPLWTRALADVSEHFPAVQGLSKIFNDKFLEMTQERSALKEKLEKLGKAVIREKNKTLGIPERALSIFSSNNAKYFDFIEQDGKLRKSTDGLTPAQKDFLSFMKELNKRRGVVYDNNDNIIEDSVLKVDKRFLEKWGKDMTFLSAASHLLGGGKNLDTEVEFTNPKTGKKESTTYQDAQKKIIEFANSKEGNKAIGLGQLVSLAYQAKKKVARSPYAINYNGALTSRFDKPYQGDSYSRDFYRAAFEFIDDITHVEKMGSLIPLYDSVQYLYKKGYDGRLPNISKLIESEMQSKIYQRELKTDPVLDSLLKFFRHLSSKTTIAFNFPANIINIAIGNYNAWREEGIGYLVKGNTRLLGKKGQPFYGIDILKKYGVVNVDKDSNPKITNGFIEKMAYIGQELGEAQIQGSSFLGHLTKEEWNSFEYKDGKLEVKDGVDEKALQTKMNDYKDRVSSIQGKYNPKDVRKYALGELGKSISAYKTWIPDYVRTRFGAEMIDKYGNVHRGSWNMFTKAALKEIKNDFSKKNNYGIVIKNGVPTLKNKQIASNLRGLLVVGLLFALTRHDDKDKKNKKFEQLSLDNTLGNLLFILDPDQAEYLVTHPVAIQGPITDVIKALSAAIHTDEKEFKKRAKRLLPYRKIEKDIEMVTK